MPSTPAITPSVNAASTTNTSGARHWVPKKKWTVASCWLFSAKANRVKKMAALSSHMRYFNHLLSDGEILTTDGWHAGIACTVSASLGVLAQFLGALVHSLAQGFARLEVGHALARDRHTLAAARVATHAGRAVVDREAAEATDLDPVATHQCVAQGVKNGLDGVFGIPVCQLAEPVGQLFNKVGSGHGFSLK